ncbi:hypothetical protein PFISCL1PPCAC_16322, partial [Pristionchus fissidentatus]
SMQSLVASETKRLNAEHRKLIRDSYEFMKVEANKNGQGIFIRLFAEFPHYKTIWPNFREIPDSALISSDGLKNHARVYMAGLQHIVESLDDDSTLGEAVKRIAMTHTKWYIKKYHIESMVPELLDVLKECMGGTLPRETAFAWTTLYDIIGNLIQMMQKNSRQSSI